MLNFDSLSLKAFIAEYAPVFIDGRVGKIQQPSKHELLLTIRAQKTVFRLYITVDPRYPHLAVISPEGEALRNIEIPKTPPMFCMLLRKHMEGSKIKDIRQPGFDRIFEIYFDSYSEIGERVRMVLACEFMGKHSNMILYNYDTNVILGCAHSVSSEKSRERELAGGLPYIYPPGQEKIDLNKISEHDFYRLIKTAPMENFGHISRALANELVKACPNEDLFRVARDTVNLKNLNPGISADMKYYSLVRLDEAIEWLGVKSVNEMLDGYFGYHVSRDKFNRLKNSLQKILNKELKQHKKQLEKQEELSQDKEKQENYKQQADELLAQNPKEAQKYYKLYKKAKTAAKHSEEMLQKTRHEIEYLESIEESLNQAETTEDLQQVKLELTGKEDKKQAKETFEPAKFASSDGFAIFAGKNNKQNEYILKISSPNDIWLHAQDIPGSHVIIKSDRDREIPETTLHEAVYIAAYYSKGRESSNVPVVYTRRKFVKKPAGSKPGFVVYNNEKTLWVNPDEQKVKSLREKD